MSAERRRRGVIVWRPGYALSAVIVFLLEVMIALFVHDRLVRPYLGDSLAVVLVYCGVRAVAPLGMRSAIALALAIACAVEFGQWFGLVGLLGLGDNRIARVVLGTGFDLHDFAAYGAGGLAVLLAEELLLRRRRGD